MIPKPTASYKERSKREEREREREKRESKGEKKMCMQITFSRKENSHFRHSFPVKKMEPSYFISRFPRLRRDIDGFY